MPQMISSNQIRKDTDRKGNELGGNNGYFKNYFYDYCISVEYVLLPTRKPFKHSEDYNQWTPFEIKISTSSETLKIDGESTNYNNIKYFVRRLDDFIANSNVPRCSLGPAENQFDIIFERITETFEKEVALVEIWLNMAYLEPVKYRKGFQFMASLDDIKTFRMDLSKQAFEIFNACHRDDPLDISNPIEKD